MKHVVREDTAPTKGRGRGGARKIEFFA